MKGYCLKQFVKARAAMKSEMGTTLVEYAYVMLLIVLVVIVMLRTVGTTNNNTYSKINSSVKDAMG